LIIEIPHNRENSKSQRTKNPFQLYEKLLLEHQATRWRLSKYLQIQPCHVPFISGITLAFPKREITISRFS